MIKDEKMVVKLEQKLKTELEKEAKKKGLSLSSYVRMILMERDK